jgi:hypothetical protein
MLRMLGRAVSWISSPHRSPGLQTSLDDHPRRNHPPRTLALERLEDRSLLAVFTAVPGIPNVTNGSVEWGDYNNSGLLSALVTGQGANGQLIADIYRNNGGGSFSAIGAGFTPVDDGTAQFGDYLNNGYLDVIVTGSSASGPVTKLYKNLGNGTFTDVTAASGINTPLWASSAAWGDFNDDGKLDLAITGFTNAAGTSAALYLYENMGNGTFKDVNKGAVWGSAWGSLAWGNDTGSGYPDLLQTGDLVSTDGFGGVLLTPFTWVWFNNMGTVTFSGWPIAAQVAHGDAVWGDFNNDGNLDILLTGQQADGTPVTKIYQGDGMGDFTDVTPSNVPALMNSSCAWGDYNNDGKLDFVISGDNASDNPVAAVFENTGTGNTVAFTDVDDLTGVDNSAVAWGDPSAGGVNGKLDFLLVGGVHGGATSLSTLYSQTGGTLNTPPTAPTGLSDTVSGNQVTFSWTESTDTQTPSNGLSYNLYFGTTAGGIDYISPEADTASGFLRVAQRGSIQTTYYSVDLTTLASTGAAITLAPLTTNYYWGVQAVDTGFKASPFATDVIGPPSISGMVWNDANGNGIDDPGEQPIVGATVNLTGPTTTTQTTNAAGGYSFTDLTAGRYTVSIVVPAGWVETFPFTNTYTITLNSGQHSNGDNFGLAQPNLTMLGPIGSAYISQTVAINWSFFDPSDKTATVALYLDTSLTQGAAGTLIVPSSSAASGTYSWNTTGATAGAYYVYGVTSDGLSSYSPGTLTLKAITQKISVVPSTSSPVDNMVTISWAYSGLSDPSEYVLFYTTDSSFSTGDISISPAQFSAFTAPNSGTFVWNTATVKAGNYYIGAFLEDITNSFSVSSMTNVSGNPPQVTVGSPKTETLTVTGPGNGAIYATGSQIPITWTAVGFGSGATLSLYYSTFSAASNAWSGTNTAITATAIQAGASGTYTWNASAVPAGTYYILASMSDSAGDSAETPSPNAPPPAASSFTIGTLTAGVQLLNPATSMFFLKNSLTAGPADQTYGYGQAGAGWLPIAGDWDGNGTVTIGLYNPVTSTFFLNNSNAGGAANLTFVYGPADPSYNGKPASLTFLPIAGDWNGDGITTVGLYNLATSTFYLKYTNSAGPADDTFTFGVGGLGWEPIAGAWNGGIMSTVGLYNPKTGTFFLKNTNTGGAADTTFGYGPGSPIAAAWLPLAGDWDGNGTATVGLYDPVNSIFYLTNSNAAGPASLTLNYGPPDPSYNGTTNLGWWPVAGEWSNMVLPRAIGLTVPATETATVGQQIPLTWTATGVRPTDMLYAIYATNPLSASGVETPLPGVVASANGTLTWNTSGVAPGTYYLGALLSDTASAGAVAYSPGVSISPPSTVPLFQQITLTPALQMAAGGPRPNSQAPALTQAELQPIVTAAIARWAAAGLDAADLAQLSHVQFVITNLPAGELGLTQSGEIFLDGTAAGYGWFVNGTPASNADFAALAVSAGLRAVDPQALDRIDLLTVVEHELGHIVGLGDVTGNGPDLMDETLGVGVRRDPSAADVDAVLASR